MTSKTQWILSSIMTFYQFSSRSDHQSRADLSGFGHSGLSDPTCSVKREFQAIRPGPSLYHPQEAQNL
jgi:hypothetical protein